MQFVVVARCLCEGQRSQPRLHDPFLVLIVLIVLLLKGRARPVTGSVVMLLLLLLLLWKPEQKGRR